MKLGVLTRDFRIYNRLLILLKGMHESFISLEPGDRTTDFDLVITDMDITGSNMFYTNGSDEFRLKQVIRARDSENITVGIDPGPSPGIATLADNIVIDRRNIYDFDEIRKYITEVRDQCSYKTLTIKIGNGDVGYRNQIIKGIADFNPLIINEKGSSKFAKRGSDSESAINIALSNDVV